MKSEFRTISSRVCIFDVQDLSRFLKIATADMSNVKITIKCSDGVSLTTDKCNEILSFKNPKSQSIIGLEVGASRTDGNLVLFEINQNLPWNCRLSVSGDEFFSSKVSRELQDVLDHARPWYGKAIEVHWPIILANGFLGMIVLLPLFLAGLIWLDLVPDTLNIVESKKIDLSALLFGIIVGFTPFFVVWIYRFFLMRFFPVLFFEIGDGVKRYRNIVIGRGFAAAVFSSILASVIYGIFV